MSQVDLIAAVVSCVLTLMVLSYLIGDNPLFRLAVHIFVGVSAGFVTAVALRQVIYPMLLQPLLEQQNMAMLLVPLVLCLLILFKAFPKLSGVGSPAMAFIVGAGAAVAIAGALLGTLLPQMMAAIQPFDPRQPDMWVTIESMTEGAVMVVGTITTLAYFHFGVKPGKKGTPPARNRLVGFLALIGQFFIAITFGVLFAGAYAASVTALIERLYFIWNFIQSFIS